MWGFMASVKKMALRSIKKKRKKEDGFEYNSVMG